MESLPVELRCLLDFPRLTENSRQTDHVLKRHAETGSLAGSASGPLHWQRHSCTRLGAAVEGVLTRCLRGKMLEAQKALEGPETDLYRRRRGLRLRSWWRHEQETALHHSPRRGSLTRTTLFGARRQSPMHLECGRAAALSPWRIACGMPALWAHSSRRATSCGGRGAGGTRW